MRVIFQIIILFFYILVYCGLLKRAELRGVKWTTKLQKLTCCCCCWNHIMKSQKKIFSSEIFTLSKMNFFPLSSFICFSHRNVGDYFENQCTLKFVFHFFCKSWKNIFKLWGLSEIYIIDISPEQTNWRWKNVHAK